MKLLKFDPESLTKIKEKMIIKNVFINCLDKMDIFEQSEISIIFNLLSEYVSILIEIYKDKDLSLFLDVIRNIALHGIEMICVNRK